MKNDKYNIPTIFIVFGGTGDLAKKKLLPALYDLNKKGYLPENFRIIGVARSEKSDKEYQTIVKQAILGDKHQHSKAKINKFLKQVSYFSLSFEDQGRYTDLKKIIKSIEFNIGQCANKIYYYAVPPIFFDSISENLYKSGLSAPCSKETGWARFLIEKPFGVDYKTARSLDSKLCKIFKNEQIFRIDHFLAKEVLQNILTFRFSNSIFEPVWNSKYIEKIEIKMFEINDASKRGAFYDRVGALLDVGQNHVLQMLALVTMDNPGDLESALIKKQRAKLFNSLKPIYSSNMKNVVRGQYAGYTKEEGVKSNSKTETYFKLLTFIDNPRWKNVPIYLESGKALKKDLTEIKVYFKEITPCLCSNVEKKHKHQNIVTFTILPKEEINIKFLVRKSGIEQLIESRDFNFDYGKTKEVDIDAYEKVLYDAICGERMLFASSEEINAEWKFIDSIKHNWAQTKLHIYKQGSNGPEVDL